MGVLHYGMGEGCVAEPTTPEAPQVALFLVMLTTFQNLLVLSRNKGIHHIGTI